MKKSKNTKEMARKNYKPRKHHPLVELIEDMGLPEIDPIFEKELNNRSFKFNSEEDEEIYNAKKEFIIKKRKTRIENIHITLLILTIDLIAISFFISSLKFNFNFFIEFSFTVFYLLWLVMINIYLIINLYDLD